jgi:hypothetical protein
MAALSALSSARKGSVNLLSLNAKITPCDLQQLIYRSASSVINRSIANVRKLLEEAKEANRMLAQRERRTNNYQILHARHQKTI